MEGFQNDATGVMRSNMSLGFRRTFKTASLYVTVMLLTKNKDLHDEEVSAIIERGEGMLLSKEWS